MLPERVREGGRHRGRNLAARTMTEESISLSFTQILSLRVLCSHGSMSRVGEYELVGASRSDTLACGYDRL